MTVIANENEKKNTEKEETQFANSILRFSLEIQFGGCTSDSLQPLNALCTAKLQWEM